MKGTDAFRQFVEHYLKAKLHSLFLSIFLPINLKLQLIGLQVSLMTLVGPPALKAKDLLAVDSTVLLAANLQELLEELVCKPELPTYKGPNMMLRRAFRLVSLLTQRLWFYFCQLKMSVFFLQFMLDLPLV